ncbi:MAG: 50S ribosomal protein L28 [Firmicutes bacterium]|jgi:large subunit ribosomal protein L28|nr:50S ribosomal protein L28 [Bacillota bacterium]
MSRMCAICGKTPVAGNNVSHSEIKTKRRWYPNLHRVRAMVSGTPRRISVCTRCLRSGKVTRAV